MPSRAPAGHRAEPISVRIGLLTGEPIKEADDFFRHAVILAARIAGAAHSLHRPGAR